MEWAPNSKAASLANSVGAGSAALMTFQFHLRKTLAAERSDSEALGLYHDPDEAWAARRNLSVKRVEDHFLKK